MKKLKTNFPKKNAGRKLATRLKELGIQPPPKGLILKINGCNAVYENVAGARV
jgi:hypothetical protein